MKIKKPKRRDYAGRNEPRRCHLPSMIMGAALLLPSILYQWFDDDGGSETTAAGLVPISSKCPVCPVPEQQEPAVAVQSAVQAAPYHQAVPILPLASCTKYTPRDTDTLDVAVQSFKLEGQTKAVKFAFLSGSHTDLEPEKLPAFATYQQDYEGAVTHAWIAILETLVANEDKDDLTNGVVLDGGMHAGFYTLLTASMGFPVHAFEVQRDCFDIMQKMLRINESQTRKFTHMYNFGLSNKPTILFAEEGCDPTYVLKQKTSNKVRKHLVPVVPLDLFLDQLDVSVTYVEEENLQRRRLADKSSSTSEDEPPQEIMVLKLDIEGSETKALEGFVKYLPNCHNIFLEFGKAQSGPLDAAFNQYKRLEADGFDAYMLYNREMTATNGKDVAFLKATGLERIAKHPVLDSPMADITDYRMMWKVTDWNLLTKAACPGACNLWFHRTRPSTNAKN